MGCSTCGGKRKYQGVTSINANQQQQSAAARSAAAAIANAGGEPESLVAISVETSEADKD